MHTAELIVIPRAAFKCSGRIQRSKPGPGEGCGESHDSSCWDLITASETFCTFCSMSSLCVKTDGVRFLDCHKSPASFWMNVSNSFHLHLHWLRFTALLGVRFKCSAVMSGVHTWLLGKDSPQPCGFGLSSVWTLPFRLVRLLSIRLHTLKPNREISCFNEICKKNIFDVRKYYLQQVKMY